jgi:hypothetical protein
MNVLDLLRSDGFTPRRVASSKGGEFASPCPACGGKDRLRSWPNSREHGQWWCRQCGRGGNAVRYLQLFRGLGYREAAAMLDSSPRVTYLGPAFAGSGHSTPESSEAERCHRALFDHAEALAYLKERGINQESMERFKLGAVRQNGIWWLTIPHYVNGVLVNIKFRSLPPADKSFRRLPGCRSVLFNSDALAQAGRVFISEGEIDAITLVQAGIPNVVGATCGAACFEPEWIDLLKDLERIYLCYDADPAGREGAFKLARRLGYERCFQVVLPEGQDVNDFFQRHGAGDFIKLVEEARAFDLPGVISLNRSLDFLGRELSEQGHQGLLTPWEEVNRAVKGFFPGDLVVVSAPPGTGKTTWCLNVACELALKGVPALFYCLEMRPERLARKVIQAEYRQEQVSPAQLEQAAGRFEGIPLYFAYGYRKEGYQEILDLIREAVKRYDLKLVVFDNLHYACRTLAHINEELAQAVQGFKLLAEEMEIPVLLIAQPRKRESGGDGIMSAEDIKYSNAVHADCDQMILLHRNRRVSTSREVAGGAPAAREQAFDPVTLVRVEKHRSGAGGEALLYFHGAFSRFDPAFCAGGKE